MSKSPPSSGRFGHPALDKVLQTLAKQAEAKADATAAQAKGVGRNASVPDVGAMLGSGAQVAPAPSWDDLLYEAMTRQRAEWMQRQGIQDDLANHGAYRTDAQRRSMGPGWMR